MLISAFIIIGIGLLVLETTLMQLLPSWVGRPDPLFILVVFFGLRLEIIRGTLLTLFFGLLVDVFSGNILGIYPLVYLAFFFLLKTLSRNLMFEDPSYQIPLVGLGCLFFGTTLYLASIIVAPENGFIWSWKDALLQALVSGVIAIPLFAIFTAVLKLSRPKKQNSFRP